MLFRLQPVLYSIIFAAALELSMYKQEWFFKVAVFFIVFSVFVVWPLARKLRFLAIPFFLSLGSLIMLSLIDQTAEKHIFIVISSAVYYLAIMGAYRLKHYDCDLTAQGMINIAAFATVFFWYVSNYGWFLNFQIDSWVLALTFLFSTFLITLPSLRICASLQLKRKRQAEELESGQKGDGLSQANFPVYMLINNWLIVFLNIILSLIMAQLIWLLSFWPFGYLTTGVVALIIYFVFWEIIRDFIQGVLTRRKVVICVVWSVLFVSAVLLTTRWSMTS
ncbi:MAG: hypothetical protein PHQ20_04120 [Candidatus Moranbacteria bacterium]|nr:hypothetical protein [Candidatus Moranbacteria bacterium]